MEDQIVISSAEARRESNDGRVLVLAGRDSPSVGFAVVRPPRFSDDSVLATSGRRDLLGLLEGIRTGAVGGHVGVKEGMAVGGAVVGSMAEFRVLKKHGEGIDRHHGALVAGAAKLATRGVDSVHDVWDRVLALVDELVADVDGVEGGPVTAGDSNDLVETGWEVLQVEDTGEDTDLTLARSLDDLSSLVTFDAVDAHVTVQTSDFVHVLVDLGLGLAGTVVVKWSIGHAKPILSLRFDGGIMRRSIVLRRRLRLGSWVRLRRWMCLRSRRRQANRGSLLRRGLASMIVLMRRWSRIVTHISRSCSSRNEGFDAQSLSKVVHVYNHTRLLIFLSKITLFKSTHRP